MDGHGDDALKDLFSQPDPIPDGAYDFFSQTGSPSGVHGPRAGIQALDLNSEAEDFPNLAVYSEMLEPRGGRTLGLRVPRNGGRGVRRARSMSSGGGCGGSMALGAAGGGGRGRSMSVGAAGGGGRGGSRMSATSGGVGRGARAGRRGPTAAGAEEAVGEDGINIEDDDGVDREGFARSSQGGESSNESSSEAVHSSSSDEEIEKMVINRRKRNRQLLTMAVFFGMYNDHCMHKVPRRIATVSGLEWVEKTLENGTACYNMFRMSRTLFFELHNLLVQSYGLKSTSKMSSIEALGMFLWILGAPQSVRQAEDRFVRSMETISRTFDKVLSSLLKVAVNIIRPLDPEFKTIHQRLQHRRFAPYFNNCIGAIDGTHIPVVVSQKSEKERQWNSMNSRA